MSIASGLVIPNQYIGITSSAQGFDGANGILRIDPADTTQGASQMQGTTSHEQVTIFYAPINTESTKNGELTLAVQSPSSILTLSRIPV